MTKITMAVAKKVLETVDAGLRSGLGRPIPGRMCVEAAVCFALGLPHGDEPDCVSPALRKLKITLNDANWSSDQTRAKGLRKLALAQLGSAGKLDDIEFAKRVALMVTNKVISKLMRHCAKIIPSHEKQLIEAAIKCEEAKELDAASVASYAASDASAASVASAAESYAASDASAASVAASAASAAARYAASAESCAASYAASAAASAASDASVASAESAASCAESYAASAASAASYAASAAASAASDASVASAESDNSLYFFADEVVLILIDMKAPGCRWLSLCE